ncbi:alpha-(1,3)-fucosyltransferase C-like [Bombyx mandarina]|uniref:Fucosyltransferase n=1 Tax=Bombyx mandarina TaxID=7092 RepID=A0A6J2JD09_BOMMA|nr:alpha-(1,3)-fucosyltransferase C-like [Bombyx mandarina]
MVSGLSSHRCDATRVLGYPDGPENRMFRLNNTIFKLAFYSVCALGVFVWYVSNLMVYTISQPIIKSTRITKLNKTVHENIKFILIWTDPAIDPIVKLGNGQQTFVERECPVKSCFVTSDRHFFKDITEFEVIIFHGKEIVRSLPAMPEIRSTHQKYIFASMESSDYYPICDVRFKGFFNWTWTYKLNSDEYNGYIIVRNKKGIIIGPKQDMDWLRIEEMDPVTKEVEIKLSRKTKIAAWFVSNCRAPSGRDYFFIEVQRELNKHGLSVDVYGECGNKICPRDDESKCFKLIKRDYYFYFAFENSLSEDYVTEKLLTAIRNYAIPVVYGAANYTRFMPNGTYLNGRDLGAKELARQMIEIYEDKKKYKRFFKWHNHYSYHDVYESPESDSICKLCAIINNKTVFDKATVYEDFNSWWNPKGRC